MKMPVFDGFSGFPRTLAGSRPGALIAVSGCVRDCHRAPIKSAMRGCAQMRALYILMAGLVGCSHVALIAVSVCVIVIERHAGVWVGHR